MSSFAPALSHPKLNRSGKTVPEPTHHLHACPTFLHPGAIPQPPPEDIFDVISIGSRAKLAALKRVHDTHMKVALMMIGDGLKHGVEVRIDGEQRPGERVIVGCAIK
jgi:hypothetical protein